MARWPFVMGSTISMLLSVGLGSWGSGLLSGAHAVCSEGRADMASVGRSPKSSNDMPRLDTRHVQETALPYSRRERVVG